MEEKSQIITIAFLDNKYLVDVNNKIENEIKSNIGRFEKVVKTIEYDEVNNRYHIHIVTLPTFLVSENFVDELKDKALISIKSFEKELYPIAVKYATL